MLFATRHFDISVRHANESVEAVVRDWFAGRIPEKVSDGMRSVVVPHPEKDGFWLKIKGAGLKGGPVKFGKFFESGLRAPVFDFDGRMMEDIASGHDNAVQGGASFQQAAVEYRISRIFQDLGFDVVPCLGYGCIRKGTDTSWFSLFEVDRNWESVVVPGFSMEEYGAAKVEMGRFLTRAAIEHNLIGHCWYVGTPGGRYYLKDLHPFRSADAVSMSQLSWVMQLFFMLHILALASIHFTRKAMVKNVPEDLQAYSFRGFLPDAKKAEHEELRWSLVSKYMLRAPGRFEQAALIETLRANRITSTLMDLCPEEYARP